MGNSSAVKTYLDKVFSQYRTGRATEHTYRGDLADLIEEIIPGVKATNEPKRQECGAPDYILTNKNNLPVGYIEAKDIGVDLKSTEKSDQLKRYKDSLENLILTDYLEFRFYRNGEKVHTITIGEINDGKLTPFKDSWERFEEYLREFCTFHIKSITSPETLAKMMAGKARLMKDIIFKALNHEDETTLKDQLEAFKKILIHDMDESTFADIYAQTIAYGLFAARLNDETPEDFSRQEALNLVPKSNPFLKKFFGYIAGVELDDRLVWIVDALAEVFGACDLNKILKNFGKSTQMRDPMIHFYETFLAKYDKELKEKRGVYYTPEPVVNFIVRAVDDILKTEFNLTKGLADTSKVNIERALQKYDGRYKDKIAKEKKDVHKVQILDPATGTGTFLAAVIKHIYENNFEKQQGMWSGYVENHLIPRIHGFEILMASYTMCHLKIDMLLKETGYKSKNHDRLQVYLTNSLEEADPYTGTILASWLSQEASEANFIKRESPVMVVLGNPPYAVSSTNKGDWIVSLIKDYKKNLNEKKINLDDDYIKFIRYGQHYIQKNGNGVLAYISNNSFLSGITHRQMRKDLMECFDKIFIIDLHGNSNIKEKKPDGSPDKNVFDIKQGVSINIFIKTGRRSKRSKVLHFDLFGERSEKYNYLVKESIKSINWSELNPTEPYNFFTSKTYKEADDYNKGFKITDLFQIKNSGVKTDRDKLFVAFEREKLLSRIKILLSKDFDADFVKRYNVKDSGSYKLIKAITDKSFDEKHLLPIQYRPFDNRWIYYDPEIISRPAKKAMKHLVFLDNLSLSLKRQSKFSFSYSFVHKSICESCLFESAYANNTEFPLYLYKDSDEQQISIGSNERIPNFEKDLVKKISDKVGLKFTLEKEKEANAFAPIDLLDYIYAILHSPSYRDKYKEFLKIDFPRIPYPEDKETFWILVEKGGELRQIHLMESPTLENHDYYFPVDGSNEVEKKDFKGNRVFINDNQYFDNIPEVAWNFYIGGYQPAQKWLKDRKGRVLEYDDISHYQRIIKALIETDRIMKEIDDVF